MIAVCNILCLDYTGENAELAARIIDGLHDLGIIMKAAERETEEEENDDENDVVEDNHGDDEFEDDVEDDNSGQQPARKTGCRFSFHFRDIENTVRQFERNTGLSVRRWIEEFEETAGLLKWDETQKLVFGKKSLTGIAKLYIQSETGIKTWRKLKTALIEEFDTKITDADIHHQLAKRKRKKEETMQ